MAATHRSKLIAAVLGAGLLTGGASAHALEQGDWLVRFGGSMIDPKSDAGNVGGDRLSVDDATQVSFTAVRMLTDNLGLELLAALPFEHDVKLAGAGKIAETKHLPPTLSLQYYFKPAPNVRPYVGAGVNYTYFWDEKGTGALAGFDVDIDDSWGLAAQVGVDVDLDETWFVNADARYIDIDTEADIQGVPGGAVGVDISPWVYTVAVGYRF